MLRSRLWEGQFMTNSVPLCVCVCVFNYIASMFEIIVHQLFYKFW